MGRAHPARCTWAHTLFPVAGQARVLPSRAADRTVIPARRAPVWLPGWEFIGKLFLHSFQFMHPIYASSFLANWWVSAPSPLTLQDACDLMGLLWMNIYVIISSMFPSHETSLTGLPAVIWLLTRYIHAMLSDWITLILYVNSNFIMARGAWSAD